MFSIKRLLTIEKCLESTKEMLVKRHMNSNNNEEQEIIDIEDTLKDIKIMIERNTVNND